MALILTALSATGCAAQKRARIAKGEWTKDDEKYAKRVRFISAADLKENESDIENYRIDTDDMIEISVWQIEELHQEIAVRPDGKISFPLIGDVAARGKTVDELKQLIGDNLKLYIKVPQVSVNIKDFGGKKAIVLGRVESPGVIRFTAPIRISEALALAGDFQTDPTDRPADKGSVFVIRDLQTDAPVIILADVSKILYQGDLRHDIIVKQGDIIFVRTSLWGNLVDFLDNTLKIALDYAKTYYGLPVTRNYIFDRDKIRKWQYD